MADHFDLDLPDDVARMARDAAHWRGMSAEGFAAAAVRYAAALDADLIAKIKKGEADLQAGRTCSQEEVETMFDVRQDQRDAA